MKTGNKQKSERMRSSKRCNELFMTTGKFSFICPKCDKSCGTWKRGSKRSILKENNG